MVKICHTQGQIKTVMTWKNTELKNQSTTPARENIRIYI
jgi:hypothetical protein